MIRFNIEQFIFNFPRYVMHSKSNVALMKHQIVFNFDKNIIEHCLIFTKTISISTPSPLFFIFTEDQNIRILYYTEGRIEMH